MNEFDMSIDSNDDFLNLELEMIDHLKKDENGDHENETNLKKKCKIGEIIILFDSNFENPSSTKEINFEFACKFCEMASNDLKEFFRHFQLDHLKITAGVNADEIHETNNLKKINQLFNEEKEQEEEEFLNESATAKEEPQPQQILSLQHHQSIETSFSDVTTIISSNSKILPTTTSTIGFMKNQANVTDQQLITHNEFSAAAVSQLSDDVDKVEETDLRHRLPSRIVSFDSATTTTKLNGKNFFQYNGIQYQIVTEDSDSELNSIIGDESDLNRDENDILFLSDLTNLNEKSQQNENDDKLIDTKLIYDSNSLNNEHNDNSETFENNNSLIMEPETKLKQAEIYKNFLHHHKTTNSDEMANNYKEPILFEIFPSASISNTIDSSKDIIKTSTTEDDTKSMNPVFLYHIIEEDLYDSDYDESNDNNDVINDNDNLNSNSSLHVRYQNNNFIELFNKSNNSQITTETDTTVKNNLDVESISKPDSGKQISSKNSERILKCNLCPKVFNKISNLKSHLAYHSGQRNYPCTYEGCTRSFIQNNDRKRHIRRIHLLERNHTCDICGKKFYILSELRDHALGMHTKDKYECVRCKLKFNSKRRLQAHKCQHLNKNNSSVAPLQQNNSKYNCEICIKGFSSEILLEKHFEFKHHDKI